MTEPPPDRWTQAEVRKRIEDTFEEAARAKAQRELARIMLDPESLQFRVQLAVLAIAAGSMEKLRLAVSNAREDFRDVIASAYAK